MDRESVSEAIVAHMEEAMRQYRRHFREPHRAEAFDLTMAQLKALLALEDGPLHMSGVAAALGVSLPSATATIDRLVSKNLVERADDPEDRRLVVCALSPAGRQVIGGMYESNRTALLELLAGLSDSELRVIERAFSIFASHAPARVGAALGREEAALPGSAPGA